jgi:hypothetical protein
MRTEKYNRRALTDYLLGSLTESDAEKFDELSITDNDFANELRLEEDDLVDAYVRGELVNSDLARFEANYLASPLRRKKVEFARTLQVAAENNFSKTSEVIEKENSRSTFVLWRMFSNFNLAIRLGFAALLIAVAGIFGFFLFNKNKPIEQVKLENSQTPQPTIQPTQTPNSNQTTPSPTVSTKNTSTEKTPEPKITPTQKPTVESTKYPTPNITALAAFVLLPPTRGGNSLQTISIPKQTTNVAFNLPLESDDFKSYQVSLKNQAGKILWQSGKLSANKSGLNIKFSAKLVSSNIYSLTVVGIGNSDDQQNIGNYSFKSVIK